MSNEIADMLRSALTAVTQERDEAKRARDHWKDLYKRAETEHDEVNEERDALRAVVRKVGIMPLASHLFTAAEADAIRAARGTDVTSTD